MHCFLDWYIWLYLVTCSLHTWYVRSKVFVYRNCRKQTEWGLCRLTSQITPLSDISYKQIGSPPPLKQLLRISILLPQCKSVLSSNCFKKNSYPLKGNVKGLHHSYLLLFSHLKTDNRSLVLTKDYYTIDSTHFIGDHLTW